MGDKTFLIPAANRYNGAWSEINQRLSIRTQFNIAHLVAITAVGSAYLTLSRSDPVDLISYVPAVAMPIISTIFVAWYRHNDGIIAALSAYCQWFEVEDRMQNNNEMPMFFGADPGKRSESIMALALGYRKLTDYATAIICFVSPVFISIDLLEKLADIKDVEDISPFIYRFIAFLFLSSWCIFLVYYVVVMHPRMRASALKLKYDVKNGVWMRD